MKLKFISENADQDLTKLKSQRIDFIFVSRYFDDSGSILLVQIIRAMGKYQNTPIILFTSDESREACINALSRLYFFWVGPELSESR